MADATVPATRPAAPPPVGRNTTVRTTRDMHDDLTVLMQHGAPLADVVREAVRHMADAYRRAWEYGDTPEGVPPRITGCTYAPPPA